jgi:hypothetical protein
MHNERLRKKSKSREVLDPTNIGQSCHDPLRARFRTFGEAPSAATSSIVASVAELRKAAR